MSAHFGATGPIKIAAAAIFVALTAHGQQRGDYVGAESCGKCHRDQFARQSASAHAHALSPAAEHRLAGSFVVSSELVRPPRYRFDFRLDRVRVTDGQASITLPIEWAFGAGEQAVTFVSRVDRDHYLEHYFTYYAASGSLAPTPGQTGLRSNTLSLAMGYLYRSVDPVSGIIKCFECHSTGPPVVSGANEIRPVELGVRCEACHGPGGPHAAGRTIQKPGTSGVGVNQLCGKCHRAPVGGPAVNEYKAWSVRYQPISLSKSVCFVKSEGALSCLTCHDPHGKLEKEAGHYDRACARCHEPAPHGGSCIECHMPSVVAQRYLEFRNHWIGVYGGEDLKLMPRR